MTERNQFSSSFCGHHAGETRGFQRVTLWGRVIPDRSDSFRRHQNARRGHRTPDCHVLGGSIHHLRAAFFVDVCKFRHQPGNRNVRTIEPLLSFASAGTLSRAVARANETKSEEPPHLKGSTNRVPFSSDRKTAGKKLSRS